MNKWLTAVFLVTYMMVCMDAFIGLLFALAALTEHSIVAGVVVFFVLLVSLVRCFIR